MAVTFQAVGTAVSATTGTLTVAWPAHVADDIALLWVTSSGGGTTETLATANGFTLINTQVTGTGTAGTKLSVYWARATSSAMASPVVTAGTDFKYGVITTYRGAMTGVSPINAFAGAVKATASTAATLPAVTTTVANAMVVLGIASDVDAATAFLTSTTNAALTSKAERFDAGTVSGLGGGIAITDGIKATAGTTGTTSAVVVSSINAMITVALTPALVATGTVTSTGTLSSVEKTTYVPPATNLQYQYRADDVTGVTSGAGLATWAPTVGSGNLTQATGANQPTWVSGAINGRAAVRWPDAANTLFMTGTTTADAQPTTIVTVLKGGTTIDLQQIQPWHWGVEMHAESGFWKIYAGISLNGAAGSVDDSAWVVITAVYNGNTSAIYKNGTLIGSGLAGVNGVGTALNMGRHSNGTRNWRGDIAEVLRYDGAMNATDRTAVHTYVQTMYGIAAVPPPASLPISETFTGTNGAAWDPTRWTNIGGNPGTIQSNRGTVVATTPGFADMLLSDMPDTSDVDVSFTVRTDAVSPGQYVELYINSTAAFEGYTVSFNVGAGYFAFYNASFDLYWDNDPYTIQIGVDYSFRFKRYGSNVYLKWWLASDAEPSTWAYQAVDAAPPAASKIVASLNTGSDGTGVVSIDNLTVAASTVEIPTATGTVNASAALSGAAFKVAIATGTTNASGTLSGVATTVVARTGTIGASSTLTATATTLYAPTGTINASSTLTGAATTVVARTGTIQATASLTATAFKVLLATGTVNSTATLTATQTATLTTTGTLNAAATLTATAVAVFVGERTGTAQATATLTATTSIITTLTGTIPASATLTGAATSVRASTGTIQATSSLTGTANVLLTATSTVTATSTLSSTASTIGLTTGTTGATSQLTGTTTLVAITTATAEVTATLTATTQAIATLTGTIGALATLTGAATFELLVRNITATGILLARRWDAELTTRNKTGALLERDNTGTLLDRTNTGTLTPRRWEGELD